MSQGALFSFCIAASRENSNTNVRVNEVYVAVRVEVDESAKKTGATKSSDLAFVYEQILARSDLRESRISVYSGDDLKVLKHATLLKAIG
jgi:hypothetical protein